MYFYGKTGHTDYPSLVMSEQLICNLIDNSHSIKIEVLTFR